MQSLSCRSSTSLLRTRHVPAAPRLTTLRPARRLSLLDERGMARCCADSKSAEYNKIMTEKMKWDPDNPYKYDFERGLYYHHILQDELLCGSQPTNADDVRYLAQAEKVDTMISVRTLPASPLSRGSCKTSLHISCGADSVQCDAACGKPSLLSKPDSSQTRTCSCKRRRTRITGAWTSTRCTAPCTTPACALRASRCAISTRARSATVCARRRTR